MKPPLYGLATMPVTPAPSELCREIDRVMLALVYRGKP
jgi:hypothetical protein